MYLIIQIYVYIICICTFRIFIQSVDDKLHFEIMLFMTYSISRTVLEYVELFFLHNSEVTINILQLVGNNMKSERKTYNYKTWLLK